MLSVTLDLTAQRADVKVTGTFTAVEGADFARRVRDEIKCAGWEPGKYSILIDATSRHVQTQSAASALRTVVSETPSKVRRIAVLADSTISRLQLRRIIPDRTVDFFEDKKLALIWLESD